MQLDADIEFKVAGLKKTTTANVEKTMKKLSNLNIEDSENDEQDIESKNDQTNEKPIEDVEIYKTLYEKFQAMLALEEKFCEKLVPQKVNLFA